MKYIINSRLYKFLRFVLKYNISNKKISRARLFYHHNILNVMTPIMTLEYLIKNKSSLVRIGDGEMYCLMNQMNNKTSNNNHCDRFIKDYLKQLMFIDHPNLVLGLLSPPNSAENYNLSRKYPKNLTLLEYNWFRFYPGIKKYINFDRIYGNASTFKIKSQDEVTYRLFSELIGNEDIVLVTSKNGLINPHHNLFYSAKSVNFIFVPHFHAHKEWNKYLDICKGFPKSSLFILSAGFLSKVLAVELTLNGYWAIDIGAVPVIYKEENVL